MQSLINLKTKYSYIFSILDYLFKKLPSIVVFLWLGWCFYLLADRVSPSELYDGYIKTEHIQAGKPATVHFKIDRSKVCEVVYIQTIYDSNNVRYALPSYPTVGARKVGKGQDLLLGIDIPAGASSGPARYEAVRKYTCNWTQDLIPFYAVTPIIYFNIE